MDPPTPQLIIGLEQNSKPGTVRVWLEIFILIVNYEILISSSIRKESTGPLVFLIAVKVGKGNFFWGTEQEGTGLGGFLFLFFLLCSFSV